MGRKSFYDWCVENEKQSLLEEWDYDKNENVTPKDISYSSAKSIWWKCKEGHSWQAGANNRIRWSVCPYCSNKRVWPGFNDFEAVCKQKGQFKLLSEWDVKRNQEEFDFLPSTVMYGSRKSVWWQCSRCGHNWKTQVDLRTMRGYGCPECRKEFKVSFNEKAIYYYIHKYIESAVENYTNLTSRNLELDIYIPDYQLGIEYDGQFYHRNKERDEKKNLLCAELGITLIRIREPDCPELNSSSIDFKMKSLLEPDLLYCLNCVFEFFRAEYGFSDNIDVDLDRDRGEIYNLIEAREKENSFEAKFPDAAKEWHPTKNGKLKPSAVRFGSNKKVWWLCSTCGNEWLMTVDQRATRGQGCPECGKKNRVISFAKNVVENRGSLLELCPDLMKEWDYEANTLNPAELPKGSNKKAFWVCHKCGYKWSAEIQSRTIGGNGCPNCRLVGISKRRQTPKVGKSLLDIYPELSACWDDRKNELLPSEVRPKSNKLAWWVCPTCQKSYQVMISRKTTMYEKTGYVACPSCNKKQGWKDKRKNAEK